MRIPKILLIVAVAGWLVSGCAMVRPSSGGEKVRVLSPGEVLTCRELGKVNVSVSPTVFGLPRSKQTITRELETIGRNNASEIKGDTIVPLTVIAEGQRTFLVYKCVDPNG